jgi:hypothetical protein
MTDAHHDQGVSGVRYVAAAGRLVAGYILAVAAGAIVFALIAHAVPDMPLLPDPVKDDPLLSLWQTAFMYFIFGLVFGIPYTILGSLAFWFLLRRRALWFLVLGTLCPAAAILLMFSTMGAISADGRMAKLLLVTLPAGLAATYVYGAIGFGFGFGRWRADERAA